MRLITTTATVLALVLGVFVRPGEAQQMVRVKDVASIAGLEDLQLLGYGLVVGLAGTGDRSRTTFTEQTIANMLKNMGIELPQRMMHVRNVAAVMVTGKLAPFKKKGSRFDVTVSSLGDASSLEGGTLIFTALQGPDGNVYASAQGPLATGGYDVRNLGISHIKKNHVLVGRIPDGAIVQAEYALNSLQKGDLRLSLSSPDFTSAVALARAVNEHYEEDFAYQLARAEDPSTVFLDYAVITRDSVRNHIPLIEFISEVENITFPIASQARVVVNERTGTIVAGGAVQISEVAVTHGGVKIEVINIPEVVQPQPFSMGQTAIVPNPKMIIEEKEAEMSVLRGTTTVADLAHSLNSLGVSPRDIIAILQAVKQAGALQAQLVIM